ncbi:ATP-binding protein [Streptomyces coelicoflavus]|uniref:ATP-binding protein n=1 Tax=Streptomyces coelicoflavus TaxID=285562 RepID=A0A6N9UTD8_9ACTN|nr:MULTISPECIES: ATP-binding protein [Streptomyces]EHN74660.1 regulator [Streptomyces coelicoflavus ZG0656]MZE46174.1 ATP-binding protein [Streptomyces sp. SID5477]NEB20997.1 ATP-binding protein [Streptomyces coelicoflavus]OWA01172.1 ATP-binding protein [Streptomyces sp. CS159]
MDGAARIGDRLRSEPVRISAEYEGIPGDIARGRELARLFLARVRTARGARVSDRAVEVVQLVVSELLTNACKYAPGPSTVDLELADDRVEVTVWDSEPVLPVPHPADPDRVGRHGLEIVMAVCQSFEVYREPSGKRMRAAVRLADAPAPRSATTLGRSA